MQFVYFEKRTYEHVQGGARRVQFYSGIRNVQTGAHLFALFCSQDLIVKISYIAYSDRLPSFLEFTKYHLCNKSRLFLSNEIVSFECNKKKTSLPAAADTQFEQEKKEKADVSLSLKWLCFCSS
jgi:hypothetical protein